MTRSYALAVEGQIGRYEGTDDLSQAFVAALALTALHRLPVTVLRVEPGHGDHIEITPVATVSRPTTPTHSTSPEVSA